MTDTCVRRAWLTLGGLSVDLEDVSAGYFCSSLDLGYPDVRDVTSNRPDADGIDDRTALMGGRVVSADITALRGAGARIDAVASSFAPFMVPAARPTLHYILDRPGAAERTLRLRASGYAWPIAGPDQRDINLQWLAADPVAKDPNTQTVTAWAGTGASGGRTYPLTFNRIYPVGGSGPVTGIISTPGDVAAQPRLRFYGPISGGYATIVFASTTVRVGFVTAFIINAGTFVDVDTRAHTAYLMGDPAQSVITSLDWARLTWPVIPPNTPATLNLIGTNTSGVTQVQAIWNDGYLT